ncbi:DinB family protein [Crocinitomicaceae bacterium]|nr:DinB family protein [Crocinitomicaceae bacterium]MDB3907611.1 DinB family protein [Crocinitomicaceae bacterium]
MSTFIKPAFQIQRINALENQLVQFQSLSLEELTRRPNPKSWSVIEVAKHMVIGHEAYRDKVNMALSLKGASDIPSEFKASAIPSFLIKRFPPREGEIKFKMKTTKKFKPVFDVSQLTIEDAERIFSELSGILNELKEWVETYRTRTISMKKFNSAVGATVRFNIPEACEFILCHNERHFLQMDRAVTN